MKFKLVFTLEIDGERVAPLQQQELELSQEAAEEFLLRMNALQTWQNKTEAQKEATFQDLSKGKLASQLIESGAIIFERWCETKLADHMRGLKAKAPRGLPSLP